MMAAGMDVARIGLAHNTLDEAIERYRRIRRVAEVGHHRCGILVDLPGPKIRVASFADGGVELPTGSTVTLRTGTGGSTTTDIQVDYESFVSDVVAGDELGFGDGGVVAVVTDTHSDHIEARITTGGELQGRPGLRIPSERMSVTSPTDDDLNKLDAFVDEGVDMVALSFVRSGHDVRRVATEPHPRGPLVVAKIETTAAIDNLPGIIDAASAIMVARGDLGLECDLEDIPHLQKRIIRDCIAGGLPVITATQMLDSMVHAPAPTRAEVTDIANAVFDGTSGVMLSAETAIGDHPVLVIETMARIARKADEEFDHQGWASRVAALRMTDATDASAAITDAMTLAASRASAELDLDAIICISGTGFTVRSMARFRPEAAIVGLSDNMRTVQQLTSSWGVTPLHFPSPASYEERVDAAVAFAQQEGLVRSGRLIGVLAGIDSHSKATDVFRLVRVP